VNVRDVSQISATVRQRTDERGLTRPLLRNVPDAIPRNGDIVIKREVRNPHVYYSVRRFPDPPQVSCVSTRTAFAFARHFGNHGAAIWQEQEGGYTLLVTTEEESPE
jgi:hypothetical protein